MAKTHGMSKTRIYKIWAGIIQRCENEGGHLYEYYGGRGIGMCRRWRRSFVSFMKDMGIPKPYETIERKHNDRDYKPSNCYWATRKEQARNRRSSKMIEFNGETKCLAEWAEELGFDQKNVSKRLLLGWDFEDAISIADGRKLGKQIEFRGRILSVRDWAKEVDVTERAIYHRLASGWNVEQALTQPVQVRAARSC